jgi:hypothetical protein
MTESQDFRDLVGDDLDEQERARLERVHEMLVFAGPPPELPPALLEPDAEPTGHHHEGLPRRRAGALLAIAAAIALVAFLGGYLYGGHSASEKFASIGTITMHGTKAAPDASATIDVGERDSSGNWPLKLVVHDLPALPRRAYYEMFLTKDGKPVASCGTFSSDNKTVTVRLNAPYNSRRYDGWVVTRHVRNSDVRPVVLTTFRNESV